MRHQVVGPLAVWATFFTVASAIRYTTFSDFNFWVHLPSDLTLWATGILFSLSISENSNYQARMLPRTKRNSSGSGFSVEYEITLPEEPGFNPKYLYLFLFAMGIWVLCLLLGGTAQSVLEAQVVVLERLLIPIIPAFLLSFAVTAATIRVLYEVSR